ncbi:putative membrane protein [Synechococcus sp. ROS8604]|nr:putative membrane protein [Synechococcus sp. ROS8604]
MGGVNDFACLALSVFVVFCGFVLARALCACVCRQLLV